MATTARAATTRAATTRATTKTTTRATKTTRRARATNEGETRAATGDDEDDARGDATRDDARARERESARRRDDAFSSFERALADAASFGSSSSSGRGWTRVDDAWALAPRAGVEAKAVVHFCGGAFVGASPQVTYGEFCERLVERGEVVVIATPVQLGLDHVRVADEAWQK